MELPKKTIDQLDLISKRVIDSGNPEKWTDPVTKIQFTISPVKWDDLNGIHGYTPHIPGIFVQTSRVAAREMASKENREVLR